METRDAHVLLEKFLRAETNLEEEQALKTYFRETSNLPPGLQPFRAFFREVEDFKSQVPADDFDLGLASRIEAMEGNGRRIRMSPLRWAAAAAVVAGLALGTWIWQSIPVQAPTAEAIDWSRYEPESTEEAFQITKSAVLFSAKKLHEGTSMAVTGVDRFKEIGKMMK